jgi:hypothetical protein
MGDVSLGFLATMGAFTSLYANDRPYFNRAIVLATIAISLTIAVCIGLSTQNLSWTAVLAVVLVSAVGTFVCNSLRVGPPGAYMLTLACAAGTAIPTHGLKVWQVGLLVLSGGIISLLTHLSGALFRPRGPETRAVSQAASAVANFAATRSDADRRTAAASLHNAWTMLVTLQPRGGADNATLVQLRTDNRRQHQIFAETIQEADDANGEAQTGSTNRDAFAETRFLEATSKPLPIGAFDARTMLRRNFQLHSPILWTTTRVALAVLFAGAAGSFLSLNHAYWMMAAAVLVLHQGSGWGSARRRGIERSAGTIIGLALAAAIFSAAPRALELLLMMAVLQFVIEMLVVWRYAIATIFITAMALTIASGGHPVIDPGGLLLARGIDTVLGCMVGLLVQYAGPHLSLEVSVRKRIEATLRAARRVISMIVAGGVTSANALEARQDLQVSIFALDEAYEARLVSTKRDSPSTPLLWPMVMASERLGYQLLAACWMVEERRPRFGTGGHLSSQQEATRLISAAFAKDLEVLAHDLNAIL